MSARSTPRSHDEYLSRCAPEARKALQKLRKSIQAAAPRAEECISYGLPAFRLNARILVYFGATAKHCLLFPGSGTTVAAHARLLRDYKTSKGTIRFQPEAPLPDSLVRRIVKARVAENAGAAKESSLPARTRKQARSDR